MIAGHGWLMAYGGPFGRRDNWIVKQTLKAKHLPTRDANNTGQIQRGAMALDQPICDP